MVKQVREVLIKGFIMPHYFSPKRKLSTRSLVSDYIRGVTVEFYVSKGVFSCSEVDEGTKLLVEVARVPSKGVILDLGCGYGAIGITLAKAYPELRVVMVDINPVAVELAKLNAVHNGVSDRVEVLCGDLYEPVKERVFDAVLTNPPLAAGMSVIQRIVAEAPHHLKPGGTLQMVLRKGANKVKELMEKFFARVEILAKKKGYTVLLAEKQE